MGHERPNTDSTVTCMNFLNQTKGWVLLCIASLLGSSAALAQPTVRFDQARYDINPGERFLVRVTLGQIPAEGLYSFGTTISFPSTNATVPALADIQADGSLDFNGVAGAGSVRIIGQGLAACKGTVNTLTTILQPTHGSHLASFVLTDSSATKYTLSLSPFNTLGPTEEIFVTGGGSVLDTQLQFGTALVNHRPQAFFTRPLTNSILPAGNVLVEADAWDFDGQIVRLEFFENGNLLASFTHGPFSIILTNLPAGVHTLDLHAFDDSGAGVTNTVTFTVLGALSAEVLSPLTLNRQTGLYRQSVRVSNNQGYTISSLILRVHGLPADVSLVNAWGTNSGVPFIGYNGPLLNGSNVIFTLEFLVPDRRVIAQPTYSVESIFIIPPLNTNGVPVKFVRSLRLLDGTFLVEFSSVLGREYAIDYSEDLSIWRRAVPTVHGNGTQLQWIDTGPPKTQTPNGLQRFYRVLQLNPP